jgi:hypothetical protein
VNGAQLLAHAREQLRDVMKSLRRRLGVEALDVGAAGDGAVRHRALLRLQRERQAHGDGQRRDVVEENDRVDAEAARQQRAARRQLDVLRELVEG